MSQPQFSQKQSTFLRCLELKNWILVNQISFGLENYCSKQATTEMSLNRPQ